MFIMKKSLILRYRCISWKSQNIMFSHEELTDLFVNKAGLALNDGDMFSPGGNGFMRLNVGTSRAILENAMKRIADALH